MYKRQDVIFVAQEITVLFLIASAINPTLTSPCDVFLAFRVAHFIETIDKIVGNRTTVYQKRHKIIDHQPTFMKNILVEDVIVLVRIKVMKFLQKPLSLIHISRSSTSGSNAGRSRSVAVAKASFNDLSDIQKLLPISFIMFGLSLIHI